jgi:hypothetical protein
MSVLCGICKKTEARWKCLTCDKLTICEGEACARKHAEVCPPRALRLEEATTVQLLEAALAKEPWKSCSCPSAADRCRSCREHDEFRGQIEKALKTAREKPWA